MATDSVGISGFAVYVPPYRVDLEQWCDWTGSDWSKIESVIGRSFRMRGPHQSIYTMAATSALRLIEQYDIDPTTVGFLGLGTESSTDNSAGAVIVRGMLDDALRAKGLPPLSRHCEVPEVKHACLGGVYAMKHALRYLALETEPRCAIVISADIAEYERGSSGEPTQGCWRRGHAAGAGAAAPARRSTRHRQRFRLSRRRLPQAHPAPSQAQRGDRSVPGPPGLQRQILHHLLPGRDAACPVRHASQAGPGAG